MTMEVNEQVKDYGPIYDETYLALRPMINIMRLHGLFLIPNHTKIDEKVQSVVDNLKFHWSTKLWFLTAATFSGIFCFCFFEILDFVPRIPDPLERIILNFVILLLSLTSFVNLLTMVVQGSKWQDYFKQWQTLDRMLDITLDKKLRAFVKTISKAYVFYVTSAVGTALYTAIAKYSSTSEDYTGDGFIIGLFSYSIFMNAALLLPEILFNCCAIAIKTRISVMKKKIWKIIKMQSDFSTVLLNDSKIDISNELEESRIAYQCLLEVIHRTNYIMGPVLCMCVLITASYLSSTIFMVFFQSLDNAGFVSLKIVFSSVCAFRLAAICIFADQIKRKILELKRAIFLIPALQSRHSQKSFHELTLLLEFIKKSSVSFSAIGFFDIDKELLNKVSGAILTYTLTILEFSQKN